MRSRWLAAWHGRAKKCLSREFYKAGSAFFTLEAALKHAHTKPVTGAGNTALSRDVRAHTKTHL